MLTYYRWSKVPEILKTKTQLRRLGFKLLKTAVPGAAIKKTYGTYNLYTMDQCEPIKQRLPVHIDIPTDVSHLAQSLYVINKSAKTSRDTKKRNYERGSYRAVTTAKRREQRLYLLKDAVIEILLREGMATVTGIHKQNLHRVCELRLKDIHDIDWQCNCYCGWDEYCEEDSCLCEHEYSDKLHDDFFSKPEIVRTQLLEQYAEQYGYRRVRLDGDKNSYSILADEVITNHFQLLSIGEYTFHRPCHASETERYPYLGEIKGLISAEASHRPIKFTLAVKLLESFLESHDALKRYRSALNAL